MGFFYVFNCIICLGMSEGNCTFLFSAGFFSIRFYTENRRANKYAEIYTDGESSIGLTSKALFSSCK